MRRTLLRHPVLSYFALTFAISCTSLMMLQPQVKGRSLILAGSILDLVPWLIVGAVVLFTHRPYWAPRGHHA